MEKAGGRPMRDFGIPVPDRIRALPTDRRGYPVPFFVRRVEGQEPDFRVMDQEAAGRALKRNLCWVCGQPMGRNVSFVGGPKSELTCSFADLPSHLECARFSAQACPFMVNPAARMRQGGLPEGVGLLPNQEAANPGITAVVVTRKWGMSPSGMALVVHAKEAVEWFCRGRPATDDEIEAAKLQARLDVERIRDARGA